MPLLAYNKTTSPLALAAGSTAVTLPASAVTGSKGPAVNVTSKLNGLLASDYTLLQAQVTAGSVEYEWTDSPEFSMVTTSNLQLEVGSVHKDVSGQPVAIYVNGGTGNDGNVGTATSPLATLAEALKRLPVSYKKSCRIIFDSDGTARTYTMPTSSHMQNTRPQGLGTQPVIMGCRRTLVASQTETAGGSNVTLQGAIPNSTVTDNPLTNVATTVNVASTTNFPSAGLAVIDQGLSTQEVVRYTGVTATSLTGVTRGIVGAAQSHIATSPIMPYLVGYWVRITSGPNSTTITDNPLSSTATTINVSSTAGFPTAGSIYLDTGANLELVTYTGVTGTSFTGVLRGIGDGIYGTTTNSSGGPAVSHSLGASVVGGTNLTQRRQIKTHTTTAITLNTLLPGNTTIGDSFIIEGSGTQINVNNWRVASSVLILKDLIINVQSGVLFSLTTHCQFQGIDVRGSFGSFAWSQLLALGMSGTYNAEGRASPFIATEDNTGIRQEGGTGFIRTTMYDVGNMTCIGTAVTIAGQAELRSGFIVTGAGGSIVVSEGSHGALVGTSANTLLFDRCPLTVQSGGKLHVSFAVISNCTGAAITAKQGGYAELTTVTGTGNSRYGVEVIDSANVRMADTASTVTGSLGDMKCGSRAVRTWSDFNNATPPSGLPSKNEFDITQFLTKPLKVAASGLAAADSFDITTAPLGSNVAALSFGTLRVVTAGANTGPYVVTDTGGTPFASVAGAPGVATLSDDGKTLTFPAGTNATAITFEYMPADGLATGSHIFQN